VDTNKIKMIFLIILLLVNVFQFIWGIYGIPFSANAVPDEEIALKIAEAVLVAAYGDAVLLDRPFVTSKPQLGNIWHVTGTLPDGFMGVTYEVIIRRHDGKVLKTGLTK